MKDASFAIAKYPTPIFHSSISPFTAPSIALDSQGRIPTMETVAFPGTKFSIQERVSSTLFQIKTLEHQEGSTLYVEEHFLEHAVKEPPERKISPLFLKETLDRLSSLLGCRYFWGGVFPQGVVTLASLYPHHSPDDPNAICQGVDCSGLLRFVTEGTTPHSTRALYTMGKEISLDSLQPLDIIVWPGHVMIFLDTDTLIEAKLAQGVILSPLKERLEEIREEKKPFLCRRIFREDCALQTLQLL